MIKGIDKKLYEELRLKQAMKDCSSCIKHKTMQCPNSSECYSTNDKPHYDGLFKYLTHYLKEFGYIK